MAGFTMVESMTSLSPHANIATDFSTNLICSKECYVHCWPMFSYVC